MSDAVPFHIFVQSHARSLQRFAWVLTGDWASAEDLVQEALAAAWPRWEQLTRPDAPELYVRQVLIRGFLRGRRRKWVGELPTLDLPELAAPDRFATGVDTRLVVRAALDKLPPRQRSVVALRYFADLTEAETAKVLGCSVGTVKAHTFKAMASLRKSNGLASLLAEGVR